MLKGRPQEERLHVYARERLQQLVDRLVHWPCTTSHVADTQLCELQHRLRSSRSLDDIMPLQLCVVSSSNKQCDSEPHQRVCLRSLMQDAVLQRSRITLPCRRRPQLMQALLPEPLQVCGFGQQVRLLSHGISTEFNSG